MFDAQTDYLLIPDKAAYRLNGFSVEFEIYLTGYGNTGAWRRVVSKGTSFDSRNFLISLKAGTNARLYASMGDGAGGDVAITGTSDLPLNRWTHVVFAHVPGQKAQLCQRPVERRGGHCGNASDECGQYLGSGRLWRGERLHPLVSTSWPFTTKP